MKKDYIQPRSEAVVFATQGMLAASATVSDTGTITGPTMQSNGRDFDDIWDDTDD